MWETFKNALVGVKDAVGIEIPGLPSDLGAMDDSVATTVQSATESATGVLDGATAATDGLADSVAGVSETAATTGDSAAQALQDITGPIGDNPPK
jgi:hypothetical protein